MVSLCISTWVMGVRTQTLRKRDCDHPHLGDALVLRFPVRTQTLRKRDCDRFVVIFCQKKVRKNSDLKKKGLRRVGDHPGLGLLEL